MPNDVIVPAPRKRAHVSGARFMGYTLHIPGGLPLATRAEYWELDGMKFTRFRAAQLLANAVNADAKGARK